MNINRTIIVERDSRELTARVVEALAAQAGLVEDVEKAQQAANDAAQAAGSATAAAAVAAGAATEATLAASSTVADIPEMLSSDRLMPLGAMILARKEGVSFEVVASNADLITAAGVMLRAVNRTGIIEQAYGGDLQRMMSAGGGRVSDEIDLIGKGVTVSGMELSAVAGAWIKPQGYSPTGGTFGNVGTIAAERRQSALTIDNIHIDGAAIPGPEVVRVLSASGTTLRFTNAASGVDDYYAGNRIQFATGAATGNHYQISAYVGATRTATLSAPLTTAPAANDDAFVGRNENAMGYAWGLYGARFNGGHCKNYPGEKQVPAAWGGKGVNFEQGVHNIRGVLPHVTNCATAYFITAHPGSFAENGEAKSVTGINVTLGHGENVGAYLTCLNIDATRTGISPANDEMSVIVDGGTYHNAGHMPWRILPTNRAKCGIINLGGANGVLVQNIRGWNDPTYPQVNPGYPTDFPSRCSYGLSGPVGALIWGHARNSQVRNITHGGDLDSVVTVGRCRAVGDDGGPGGVVGQMIGWDMSGIRVNGTVQNVVASYAPPTNSGAEIVGKWEISVEVCTGDIVPPSWPTAKRLILDLTETSTGKRVIGTPEQIIAVGNRFSGLTEGVTDLRDGMSARQTLAVGTVMSFTPSREFGALEVISSSALVKTQRLSFRTISPPWMEGPVTAGTSVDLATGPLTGTTGTSGRLTVSAATDGKIYIENRLSGAVQIIARQQ